ncbi:MAG: hypothetical protein KAG96_07295 [Ichthyobacteriaceae bacterium]|nr:hypothetical protein [Ichthyobacteriaceae bacterium]
MDNSNFKNVKSKIKTTNDDVYWCIDDVYDSFDFDYVCNRVEKKKCIDDSLSDIDDF